jgi:hypothetical protein
MGPGLRAGERFASLGGCGCVREGAGKTRAKRSRPRWRKNGLLLTAASGHSAGEGQGREENPGEFDSEFPGNRGAQDSFHIAILEGSGGTPDTDPRAHRQPLTGSWAGTHVRRGYRLRRYDEAWGEICRLQIVRVAGRRGQGYSARCELDELRHDAGKGAGQRYLREAAGPAAAGRCVQRDAGGRD